MNKKDIEKNLKLLIERQNQVLDLLKINYEESPKTPWLLSDKQYIKVEKDFCGKSVWVISPDLKNVATKYDFEILVKNNLRKGVNYTYIIPTEKSKDSDLNIRKADLITWYATFKKGLGMDKGQLLFTPINSSHFDLFLETHIVILNTNNVSERGIYLQLPYDQNGEDEGGYWIKLAQNATTQFYSQLIKIMGANKKKEKSN